jgi:hypothetical protein
VSVDLESGVPARVLAERAFAVEQWIAWEQPCTYAIAADALMTARARLFLECTPQASSARQPHAVPAR